MSVSTGRAVVPGSGRVLAELPDLRVDRNWEEKQKPRKLYSMSVLVFLFSFASYYNVSMMDTLHGAL